MLTSSQHANKATTTAVAETTATEIAATETTSASDQNSSPDTSEPSQSPATKVFAITELLEEILLSVDDIKSLMLMRRVAHKWRAVIDDNASLNKRKWLAPQQLDHEWYLVPGETHLRKRPKPTDAAAASTAAADSGVVIYNSGLINPFLFKAHCLRPIWASNFHNTWVSQPLCLLGAAMSSFRKPHSLFLKMFATQPPVPVMYLRIRKGEHRHGNYRCLVEQIKNTKGVKVGDVLRAVSCFSEGQALAFVVEEMMFPLDAAAERGISIEPWVGFLSYE